MSGGCWIVRRGDKQIQIKKGLPQSFKGYDSNGYSLFYAVTTVLNEIIFPKAKKYPPTIFRYLIPRKLADEKIINQCQMQQLSLTASILLTNGRQEKERKKSKRQRDRE